MNGCSVLDRENEGALHCNHSVREEYKPGKSSNSQGGRTLDAKLAMEDQDVLLGPITAPTWSWFVVTKQEFLNRLGGIQVDRTGYMATLILVIESAVDYPIRVDLRIVLTGK